MRNVIGCVPCKRMIPVNLLAAHNRRVHRGTGWFSERRPVVQPPAGSGSRSRDTSEGRGTERARWEKGSEEQSPQSHPQAWILPHLRQDQVRH